MPKWLILIQTQSEKPGNITKWLSELDQEYKTINLWEEKIPINPNFYSGLVIMGGTMSANDLALHPFLTDEINLIKLWLKTKKPLLGICLGAQLMAKALGEKVHTGKQPEIGWVPIHFTKEGASDFIFKDFAPKVTVFQWHYDTFDLPQNIVRLASSELYPNQSFRVGNNAYALQFHPEVDEELIDSWIKIHRNKLMQMNPELHQKILTDTRIYLDTFEKLGRHIIKSLCYELGEPT
jgi:GMP synthase (glutamine-hydrolysing)